MGDIIIDCLPYVFFIIVVGFLASIAIITIDAIYKEPIAADEANKICKQRGFDQHKSFDRKGLLSTKPVAIKCEYSEKYTDLGVRTTS